MDTVYEMGVAMTLSPAYELWGLAHAYHPPPPPKRKHWCGCPHSTQRILCQSRLVQYQANN